MYNLVEPKNIALFLVDLVDLRQFRIRSANERHKHALAAAAARQNTAEIKVFFDLTAAGIQHHSCTDH
jgi:hypothetical protein